MLTHASTVDLPSGAVALLYMFADDMQILCISDDAALAAFDLVERWCVGTGMALNRLKTKGLSLSLGRRANYLAPYFAVYADEADPARRAAARARWLECLHGGPSSRQIYIQIV